MVPTPRDPVSWDGYEGRASSSGSPCSDVLDEEEALLDSGSDGECSQQPLAHHNRRRSSLTIRLAAMADIGGVNSFRSFARSWQRAASFAEVIPRRPSFILQAEAETFPVPCNNDDIQYSRSRLGSQPPPHAGLLRQHLEASAAQNSGSGEETFTDSSVGAGPAGGAPREDFRERERKGLEAEMASGALLDGPSSARSSIFAVPPHLATPSLIGSYGSRYGTMGVRRYRSRSSASYDSTWGVLRDRRGDQDDDDVPLGEEQPILVKEIKRGETVVLAVDGQSTLPQSIFNSINAIIGVGLLSLPLAFKMSGWIIGVLMLTLTAAVTAHTGKLIGKCMEYDPSIITYSDLAYVAFGARARVVVSALFTLELVAACVALVILFADSLDLLMPTVASTTIWKCVCAALVLILNMLPLRWLSYTSIVGIFSTFCIVCIVLVDGLVKQHSPGSLWEPATTYLLPSNWLSLPLAYGLMASPWGAHSVFPSIYRDMRHPRKWNKGVNITFSVSYALDTCLAIVGVLMFGDGIREAITSNILKTSGYPESLTMLMCIFITIIPLTKIPLNARPLITTADVVCGLQKDHHNLHHQRSWWNGRSSIFANILRTGIRVLIVSVLLTISIIFPAFDSVCAFLGAALCTLISIILPLCFYLKVYSKDITKWERVASWILLATFAVFGLAGTVWAFLPKQVVGG
ncbi:Amino acid transporter, transmembrane [Metarhizium album ARSEF 1941]|uniref:Amino acid transporter, transmembrane n=1 Tax=Metarhizium album (strain ARSEF 1941) TaxID=1081103 RepID=A0A0B2WVM9_METAS|nr:Amino acid transporter, transmembrane [Metarhizium album ARSEF 1941]KHN97674.1 Amino acid transporter, transmembrane [Metarhizium album ARSEF 1941]